MRSGTPICQFCISVALGMMALLGGSVNSQALDKVVFGNPNPAGLNIGLAPFFYAMEMGFFEQEGIKVEFVNFNGGGVLDPQLANKSVDIGWQGPDSIVISNDVGKSPLPLRYFYDHVRHYVWEIAVPAASKIKELKDLKGAKIGVNSLTTTSLTTTKSMLRAAGLDPEKDVTFISVGIGGPAFHALTTGQVDALNLFDTMDQILENSGFKLRRLALPHRYMSLFENSFLTHADNIKDKKKQLVGFARAIAKGTVGCYANLPACVKIAWKQDPKTKPAGKSDAANLKDSIAILESRGKAYLDFPGGAKGATGHWGEFTDAMWTNRVKVLHENGIIKTENMDPKNFYTNALIPDINKFDTEAVVKQAEALK
jgi:NitT/TauT family transport system substrate-binding protein